MITPDDLALAGNPLPLQALFYSGEVKTHLDLGSNDGRTLRGLETEGLTCIELFRPSVEKLRQQGMRAIEEDVRNWTRVMAEQGKFYERVTMFDVIEHMPREDGERIIEQIEAIASREIVFFVPVETPEIAAAPDFQAYREWGLSQHPDGQRELHDHKAFWSQKDFTDRGYMVLTLHDFHGPGWDAFFAAKYKREDDKQVVVERVNAFLEQGELPKPAEAKLIQPLMVTGRQHMHLGKGVVIGYGARIECIEEYGGARYQPQLEIGDGTTAEMFLHVGCAGHVKIGRDCIIAGHVGIWDHEHGTAMDRPLHGQPLVVGEVEVGDSCLIGEGVTILPGVHIGERCVVGAGAVVTSDIPAFSLAVGVPARVLRSLRQTPPLTSIIIPTHNGKELLAACLKSIADVTGVPHEVIVVDNGSTDGTLEWLETWQETHDNLRVAVLNTNRGWPGGVNRGLALARGEYICLLNNDTEVTRGWLSEMQSVFNTHPDTGLVGPMSDRVSGPQAGARGPGMSQVQRLVGFCLLMRRAVLDKLGGLDERFGLGNFDDDDYCLRAMIAGYTCRIAHNAFVHHKAFQTWPKVGADLGEQLARNRALFLDKWGLVEGQTEAWVPEYDRAVHYVPIPELV